MSSLYSGVIQAVVALATLALVVGGLASTWLATHPHRKKLVPALGSLAAVAAIVAAVVLVQLASEKKPRSDPPRADATTTSPVPSAAVLPPPSSSVVTGLKNSPFPPDPLSSAAPVSSASQQILPAPSPAPLAPVLPPVADEVPSSTRAPAVPDLEAYFQQALALKPGWRNQTDVRIVFADRPSLSERARGVVACRIEASIVRNGHTLVPQNVFDGLATAVQGEPLGPLPRLSCEKAIDGILESLVRP